MAINHESETCPDAEAGWQKPKAKRELEAEAARLADALSSTRHSEERLYLALENTGIGVWDWNLQTGDLWMSPAGLAMQGLSALPAIGFDTAAEHFADPKDWPDWRQQLIECLAGKNEYIEGEHKLKHSSGRHIWVMERVRVVARSPSGRALRVIGTRMETTQRREAEERLRWLAQHDPLTGLPNRTVFDDMLTAAILGCDRLGHRAGLIFVDLDDFKTVNDRHGHERGDTVLCEIAAQLRDAFPVPATAARIGGDEFGIVVPKLDRAANLEIMCARAAALDGPVGLSVGGAVYPDHADSLRALKLAADRALYRAKREGRARAHLHDPAMP